MIRKYDMDTNSWLVGFYSRGRFVVVDKIQNY